MNNAKNTTLFPYLERLLEGEAVEWKTLGEVAEFKRGQTITQKTAQEGVYPVISGGQQPAYYIDQYNQTGQTITVAGSGAYAGFVMFWNEPIFVSDAFSIKANEEVLLPRYVFHFLLNKQSSIFNLKKGVGVPHVYAKDLAVFSIPIPPLRVQARIVEILDKFTELEAELEKELAAELEARKKQYAYYRDRLLNFSQYPPLNVNIEWKTLGEVCKIKNGKDYKHLSHGDIPVYGSGGIMKYVDEATYNQPSVLIPRKGSLNNLFYVDTPFWNVDTIYYTEINTNHILPKFLYHYLTTRELEKMNLAGGVPSLTQTALKTIPIPLPPLSEQRRIVDILDRFDTLTNSISEGLPKEIALRRKQYEYYRDALLNFPRAEVMA